VFVVVTLMGGVTTTIVDVIDVVAVRDGDMTAPLAVHVVMPLVSAVLVGLALVVVAVVRFVQVPVVDIVDVVTVGDGDMPAPIAMGVPVFKVLGVHCGHFGLPLKVVGRTGSTSDHSHIN
jgi:hypothetical protein